MRQIGNGFGADGQAGAGGDDGLGLDDTSLECRRHCEWFERGTWLEHIGDAAVTHLFRLHVDAIIRIEIGLVDERQNFTGFRVEHHQCTALGVVGFNGRLQFAMGEILKALINRQIQGFTFARRFQIFDVLNDTTLAILDHALLSRSPGKHGLLRELDAFLTLIVQTSKTDDVRGNVARRIVATEFALLKHAGNF